MESERVAQLIRKRFAEHYQRTPVAWPNAAFTPPDDEPWVRLTILGGDGRQVATAGRRLRRVGVVKVQVFVPEGSGDPQARSIADEVASLFEAGTYEGIRFRASDLEHVGPDGASYQLNVSIPFEWDE